MTNLRENSNMAFNNEKLNVGEHFIYNEIEFICLDIIDGNYFAMTAEPWQTMPFDVDDRNDWRNSSLRRVLNSDFLELFDRKHLIKQTSDLIADNGDKKYGTSEDYVTILSCDQYRKYRDLVPLFSDYMWTLTPRTCDAVSANYVRYLNPIGCINNNSARSTCGVAPVCLFSSENLKVCRQVHLVGVEEDDE